MWRVHPDKMIKMTVSESCNFDVQWQAGNTAVILNVCGFYTDLFQLASIKGKKRFFSLSL